MDFIELDGLALRYDLSGTGERTLVLVHEMGGSLESFDEVAPRFAPSRRAKALELAATIETSGMAFAVKESMLNGYAPELRGDSKRFRRASQGCVQTGQAC